VAFKTVLAQQKADATHIVSLSHIKRLATESGVGEDDFNAALLFLHDRGCILYFPHHALLKNNVIIDVSWILERLDSLILFSNNIEKGVAALSAIEQIWLSESTLGNQVYIIVCSAFPIFFNFPSSGGDSRAG
jgi:hypothetical protein